MISLDYSVVSVSIENCSSGIICFKKSFKMILINFLLTFFQIFKVTFNFA